MHTHGRGAGAMIDWVLSVIDALGALGVGLLIFLDNIIPPIPSEAILPLAGYRASQGAFSAVSLWLGATLGAVAGAYVLYGLGAWLGYDRLHELAGKRWFVLSSQRDLKRGRDLFDRYGDAFVLGSRCIPLLRSVVSIPAGIARMPLVRFTILTTTGSRGAGELGTGWQCARSVCVRARTDAGAGLECAAHSTSMTGSERVADERVRVGRAAAGVGAERHGGSALRAHRHLSARQQDL